MLRVCEGRLVVGFRSSSEATIRRKMVVEG